MLLFLTCLPTGSWSPEALMAPSCTSADPAVKCTEGKVHLYTTVHVLSDCFYLSIIFVLAAFVSADHVRSENALFSKSRFLLSFSSNVTNCLSPHLKSKTTPGFRGCSLSVTDQRKKSVCVQNLGFHHSLKISFHCKALTPRAGKKGQPTLLRRIAGHSAVAGCSCLWCRTYWFGTCLQLKGKKRSLRLTGELLSLAPLPHLLVLLFGLEKKTAPLPLCSTTWHDIEI